MKDIFKVSFVIIGTMIGAGFASGQEIYLFFNHYGKIGILGIIISCTLTALIIYSTFKILIKKHIHTHSELLENLNKNKKINNIIEIMIKSFLAVSFFIMVAGFSAYFKQEFKIPTYISAIVMAVLCYITFMNDTKGIVSINTVLIPFLTIFIFYLGIKNLPFTINNIQNDTTSVFSLGWIISSILYASYNSILLIPILIEMSDYMNTKCKIKKTSIMCGIILAILGICLFGLLLRGDISIVKMELPLMQVVKQFGNIYKLIYGVVIIIAIFTSAIAAGYGFLKNITTDKKKYKKNAILICLISIIIAPLGFSNLVSFLYPIFGILGLIQFCVILKYSWRH